ncbi:MAG: hypothetical protein NTY38_30945, partial [Acidobacteria bacterium]|nr:hypothetical protein [Acidobacteriota bacterium]
VKPGRTGKGQRQQPVAAALGAPQLPPVTPVERERDGSAVRRPPLSNEVGIAGSSPSGFTLSALSRGNRITEGSSFPANDTVLGELGDGDLKILVQLDGGRVPRGKLSVEWYLNGVRMDRRPAVLNQVVEYGNQPTPGTYEVLLKLNERAVQRFTFRITP